MVLRVSARPSETLNWRARAVGPGSSFITRAQPVSMPFALPCHGSNSKPLYPPSLTTPHRCQWASKARKGEAAAIALMVWSS